MKKWKIVITETLTRTVEAEADAENKDAAIDIVRTKYKRGEIILGAEDYCCTEFEAQQDEDEPV